MCKGNSDGVTEQEWREMIRWLAKIGQNSVCPFRGALSNAVTRCYSPGAGSARSSAFHTSGRNCVRPSAGV